ncbi:penicillin-binding transpeptidase domain-containing protein [Olivibacter domesticus]|uniref:Beta-lactamase n=1 Tax=Olivibacter domesticus TaxID=407022 RepID=A0A1H7QKX4_OLID1|nr:penicillin-binding transpeptidase domain-containing protein [Olivibacter domesticus]SEL48576.1 beta-lactamase class D [Olivibacter domesticus]
MTNKSALLLIFISIYISVSVYAQKTLQQPFDDCQTDGSITIYNYNTGKWIVSDSTDSHVASLPASTFKILNTLIILETEIIKDENEIIKWPGSTDTTKYGYRPDIYHDMSLKEAFHLSAGWVYRELAKEVGKERYRDYLKRCNYGNGDVSTPDPDFWNYGNFEISPVNQIEILKGVYEETLPFSKRSIQILKQMMIEEKTPIYTLRAKTGWTKDGGKDTGWWVGYIEKKDNVYFFATRLVKERTITNPNFNKCRKSITKEILRSLKIL